MDQNFDKLIGIVNELTSIGNAFREMWLNADVETGLFSFENYQYIMMTNRSRRGGGCF